MPAQPGGLLPGQSAPVTVITPEDQTGVLIIATALGLIFALLSLVIRVYVRYELSRSFGKDDVMVVVAFIFSLFQVSAVFVEITHGLGKTGKDVREANLIPLQKASYASDILYIITLWITKASMAFMFLRLSPDPHQQTMSKTSLVMFAVLGSVSVFIVALRCEISHPWIFIDTKCTGVFPRWQAIAAFDIATEIALFAIPIWIVHNLQMPLKRKITVVTGFIFRLPIIAPTILRLHYISTFLRSSNPTLDAEYATIYTQVELAWAMIAATIPCLRPFMTATHTTFGGHGATITRSSKYLPNSNSSGKKNGVLVSLTSRLRGEKSHNQSQNNDISLNTHTGKGWEPEGDVTGMEVGTATTVGGGRDDQRSVGSHDSKQMMIRRDVEWSVEYENHHRDSDVR